MRNRRAGRGEDGEPEVDSSGYMSAFVFDIRDAFHAGLVEPDLADKEQWADSGSRHRPGDA